VVVAHTTVVLVAQVVRAFFIFVGRFDMTRRDLGYVSGYTTVQAFANTYGTAAGGTAVTISGVNYQYVSFTASGSFTPTSAGLFDVLVFGGGGGGGADNTYAGGGGSGGILQQTIYLNTSAQTVTIGGGGAVDQCGNPSSIGSIPTAVTAAGGSSMVVVSGRYQTVGGMMGTGVGGQTGPTNSQGYTGGLSASLAGGGGGSTTAVGGNASSSVGGAGGAGFDVSAFIGGSALFKGAGGGGGGDNTGGAGGSSIGGRGSSNTLTGTAAAANTASGGGSRASSNSGLAGGSGIIYIRWKV
jgi:hypothetical protein